MPKQDKIPLQQPSTSQEYISSSDLLSIDKSSKRQTSISYQKDLNSKHPQIKSQLTIPEAAKDDPITAFINDFQIKKFEKWLSDFYHKREEWQNIDYRTAKMITDWKKQYILTIQDLRLRSVAMGVSGAVMYKIVSIRTVSSLSRLRNLGISFAVMGMIWTPQLFNPFLKRK